VNRMSSGTASEMKLAFMPTMVSFLDDPVSWLDSEGLLRDGFVFGIEFFALIAWTRDRVRGSLLVA